MNSGCSGWSDEKFTRWQIFKWTNAIGQRLGGKHFVVFVFTICSKLFVFLAVKQGTTIAHVARHLL